MRLRKKILNISLFAFWCGPVRLAAAVAAAALIAAGLIIWGLERRERGGQRRSDC